MPAVALEKLPVQMLGLGLLGFDHLQIVLQTDTGGAAIGQEAWFVIEGLREADGDDVRLAVEGWHGGTTLSEANGGLTGQALADRIGSSASRGARVLADGPQAMELWATLVSYAADIEAQRFPYIPIALAGSPLPIINSSSLAASLLHQAGLDIAAALPAGLRFSPGLSTLLGTSRDDALTAQGGFTTLVGGDGGDVLRGRDDARTIDKLYGGRGDDTLRWSHGVNVLHGGQPGLAYADDGVDTLDYSGAGDLRLEAPRRGEAHVQPDFIVFHARGQDQLYSVEEVIWDGAGDRLSIGKGVGLAARPLAIRADGSAGSPASILDLSTADSGFEIRASGPDCGLVLAGRFDTARPDSGSPLSLRGLCHIVGSPFADRYVVDAATGSLAVTNASPDDRVLLAWLPLRARLATDAERPRDLVIHLDAASAPSVEIRVADYRTGDLGLAIDLEAAAGRCLRITVSAASDGDGAPLWHLGGAGPDADPDDFADELSDVLDCDFHPDANAADAMDVLGAS